MSRNTRLLTATLAATACLGASITAAQQPATAPTDPHAVYEQKCGHCHNEHGADLARQKFKLAGEKVVVKRTGKDVQSLLAKHHGVIVSPADWQALAALFKLGLSTGGAFQMRCARCHERAVTLAREKLALANDRLVVKSTGSELAAFLPGHGGVSPSPAEIEAMSRALKFHLETAPGKH